MERFWETEEWLNYLLNSKFTEQINRSFYLDNKFVPLIQEEQEFYSPGFEDNKKILFKIQDLAQKHNIKRIQVDSQIKSYLNISGYTCIINPFEINPTKGHKSAIKKSYEYITCYRYNPCSLLSFMENYCKIAGKQTRPEKSFKILDTWLGNYGFLLSAFVDTKIAGEIYILFYKNWAYYFMGYTKQEYKQFNVTHYLQSIVFEILKDMKITQYEIGDQVYNSLYFQPTEKEKNISLFKRGFGGNIVLKPKSEYFFDEQYYKETMLNRINNYWSKEHENINSIS